MTFHRLHIERLGQKPATGCAKEMRETQKHTDATENRRAWYARNIDVSLCINCGKPATYKWMRFGFCSKHRDSGKRCAAAFKTAADLERVGLKLDFSAEAL